MIGRLTGAIVDETPDGTITVDVNGVGYEVYVPLGALGRTLRLKNGDISLHIHTHVREDAIVLFGFPTREDRTVFRHLISVSSIGPKLGLAILGTMNAPELADAIVRGDGSRLTAVPGVGKKTAQRLVLELRDKFLLLSTGKAPAGAPAPKGDSADLLLRALTGMGFRPAQAEQAISALSGRLATDPLDVLIREALAILSK